MILPSEETFEFIPLSFWYGLRSQFSGNGHTRVQLSARQPAAARAFPARQIIVTVEEWDGFRTAAPNTNVLAVQIADAKARLKLFRPGRYPVVRGTALIVHLFADSVYNGPNRPACWWVPWSILPTSRIAVGPG
jgi:hypothetical protein